MKWIDAKTNVGGNRLTVLVTALWLRLRGARRRLSRVRRGCGGRGGRPEEILANRCLGRWNFLRTIISIYIKDAIRLLTWVSAVGVSGSAEGFGESCQAKRSCDLASRYSSSVSQDSTQTSRFTCRSGCCESLGYHSK